MKIEYRGKSEVHDYREGYITYNSNSNEEEKFNRIYDFLSDKGWKIECEEECASILVHDKEEYNYLLNDYKEAKKNL